MAMGILFFFLILVLTACGGASRRAGTGVAASNSAAPRAQIVQPGAQVRVPFTLPATAPLYYGGGLADPVKISVLALGSDTPILVEQVPTPSGEVVWDTSGLAPGCYQPVYEAPPASGLPEGVQSFGEPFYLFALAGDGVPTAALVAGDVASVDVTVGFPSASGRVDVIADADGDPATTGDQVVVATQALTDGVHLLPVDTSALDAGTWTLFLAGTDDGFGVVQSATAQPGPLAIWTLEASDVPGTLQAPAAPLALTTAFGFPSGAGTFVIVHDVDGDPLTTGDQTVLASGAADAGVTSVALDTGTVPCDVPGAVLVLATDPTYGDHSVVAASGPLEVGAVAQMEAFVVTADGSPTTFTFTNTYCSPVVVCTILHANNTLSVLPRVSNVTRTGFDLRLQNPRDLPVLAESVSVVVVEEGAWTIDGMAIEAQTYTSTVTDRKRSWIGEARTYGNTYTAPVVIGQVMSENDPDWSVFWCRGARRQDSPSPTVLFTGKHVGEDTDRTRADETVGFIVVESGHRTILGGAVELEAAVGADSVNHTSTTYTWLAPFSVAPSLAISAIAGEDGGDGAWAVLDDMSATGLGAGFFVLEDLIGDGERTHTRERLGYLAIDRPFSHR